MGVKLAMSKLPEAALVDIATLLKALADPMRMKLIRAMHASERSVSQLIKDVGGLQANVSKHLGILARVGLISARRDGTTVYYKLADPCVKVICQSVCDGYGRILEKKMSHVRSK